MAHFICVHINNVEGSAKTQQEFCEILPSVILKQIGLFKLCYYAVLIYGSVFEIPY